MSRQSQYEELLAPLVASGGAGELARYLRANSNLPGPRGNLELAFAFAAALSSAAAAQRRWSLLEQWLRLSPAQAPVNSPAEFLPFCACLALGAAYAGLTERRRQAVLVRLREAAGDPRWRMREAAAMGLQEIGEADPEELKRVVAAWLPGSSFLEKRALLAALAHPPLLGDETFAVYCLSVAAGIVRSVAQAAPGERRTQEFKVLRQGLSYALSVFVARAPEPGFALLTQMAHAEDDELRRVVRANLKKSRLARRFPEQVARLAADSSRRRG